MRGTLTVTTARQVLSTVQRLLSKVSEQATDDAFEKAMKAEFVFDFARDLESLGRSDKYIADQASTVGH